MKKGRDAGFSSKRSGNAGSGPPLPDPDYDAVAQTFAEQEPRRKLLDPIFEEA